jgi:outer membrane protein insertion porin family
MLCCKFRSKMAALLTTGFCLVLFSSIALAQQSKLIENLDVQGNRRLTDEEILRHIKIRPGERFDQDRVEEDLRSLLKLSDLDPSNTRVVTEVGVRGGVNVIFQVRELPLIVELRFEGLRYVTKDELLAELRQQNAEVTVDSPYQPSKVRKARNVIQDYLLKRGFSDAKVFLTEEILSATTLKLVFVIDEIPDRDERL